MIIIEPNRCQTFSISCTEAICNVKGATALAENRQWTKRIHHKLNLKWCTVNEAKGYERWKFRYTDGLQFLKQTACRIRQVNRDCRPAQPLKMTKSLSADSFIHKYDSTKVNTYCVMTHQDFTEHSTNPWPSLPLLNQGDFNTASPLSETHQVVL